MTVIIINAVLYIIANPIDGDIVLHTGTLESCERFVESYQYNQSNDGFDSQSVINHPYS